MHVLSRRGRRPLLRHGSEVRGLWRREGERLRRGGSLLVCWIQGLQELLEEGGGVAARVADAAAEPRPGLLRILVVGPLHGLDLRHELFLGGARHARGCALRVDGPVLELVDEVPQLPGLVHAGVLLSIQVALAVVPPCLLGIGVGALQVLDLPNQLGLGVSAHFVHRHFRVPAQHAHVVGREEVLQDGFVVEAWVLLAGEVHVAVLPPSLLGLVVGPLQGLDPLHQ
mmetsp:Transcript_5014/g.14656  ORF Transcript_5014/g.14656 Transcript_5014/m.14656 type:complete len:227 (+) Transcript_5014:894-1574(+)